MSNYPSKEQVETADRMQICRWYRFLPSATNTTDAETMDKIVERFKELGGFTPEISKAIGW